MKKNVKKQKNGNREKQYEFPIFDQIEDGDVNSIKHCKLVGIPVALITLPHRLPHLYAVYEGASQEEADKMNRFFNGWSRKEARDAAKRARYEVSYQKLLEGGFDAAKGGASPEDIYIRKEMLKTLYGALGGLTEERRRLCRMVAEKEPERRGGAGDEAIHHA